jgi:hypothetical protein
MPDANIDIDEECKAKGLVDVIFPQCVSCREELVIKDEKEIVVCW